MAELDLDELGVFARVVEHASFAAAARALKVPTSTVSRAIGRLEAKAGVRLFQRTTRILRPTAEGAQLFADVSPAIAILRAAARGLEPAAKKPKGRLRVTTSAELCASFLGEVIVRFGERYPGVDLEFSLTNAQADLVEGGFDVAIRATAKLRDSSLVVKKLGDIDHRFYASPEYLRKHGPPRTPAELVERDVVLFRAKDMKRAWAIRGGKAEQNVEVRGRITGDDFTFVRTIVLAGGGIGLLPRLTCASDEASGALVRVLPEHHVRGATLYLVYPSAEHLPPRVTAFRDFLAEAFAHWNRS